MNRHWVYIYLDHAGHRFTATARMQKARLSAVSAWCLANGFATHFVAARAVSKTQANAVKHREISRFRRMGYAYVPRPPLS